MPEIYLLDFDDFNEGKLAEHSVAPEEVWQLLGNRHITRPNPEGPPGRIQMIGRTNGGRVLTVRFDPTADPGVWRPVTSWDSDENETKLLERHGR